MGNAETTPEIPVTPSDVLPTTAKPETPKPILKPLTNSGRAGAASLGTEQAQERVKSQLSSLQADWCEVTSCSIDELNDCEIPFEDFTHLDPIMGLNEAAQKSLFRIYDFDHNGKISWQEYVCIFALISDGTAEEKITLIFNSYDENGSGTLTKDEFTAMVTEAAHKGQNLDDEAQQFIDSAWEACTKGQAGVQLSLLQFLEWLKKNPKIYDQVHAVVNLK